MASITVASDAAARRKERSASMVCA
jgi:hypothetical protein